MRRLLVIGLLVIALPLPLAAWGFDVHRFIIGEAIDRLPPEMRPFYQAHRTFLVEYSVVPDLMRNLDVAEEPPRHFLDMDAYGEYPFRDLPRDYGWDQLLRAPVRASDVDADHFSIMERVSLRALQTDAENVVLAR